MLVRSLSAAFSLGLVASLPATAESADAQPPKARLTVEDDAYDVPLGKPFALNVNGERVVMRIDPHTERTFEQSGVSFRYPQAFESSINTEDPGVTIRTLQGRSAAIVVQHYTDPLSPESLAEALTTSVVDQAGDTSLRKTPFRLEAGDRVYEGQQLLTVRSTEAAGDLEFLQSIFTFANRKGVFALMLQDSRPVGDGDSPEYTEGLRLLRETLKTGPAPERPTPPDEGPEEDS